MELFSESSNPSSYNAIENGSRSNLYEVQKLRDWNTFCKYLTKHQPPLSPTMCNGSHVVEFLQYLDQFGRTKVHNQNCPFFGMPKPASPCSCPVRQAWGSLDAIVGRLRAAYNKEIIGTTPPNNPFADEVVRDYLRDVYDFQSKARGISFEKKRKRSNPNINTTISQSFS